MVEQRKRWKKEGPYINIICWLMKSYDEYYVFYLLVLAEDQTQNFELKNDIRTFTQS